LALENFEVVRMHEMTTIYRYGSINNMGLVPNRKLRDVVWGLNSLFTDLLNFDNPLNMEAAEHYARKSFKTKGPEFVRIYAKR